MLTKVQATIYEGQVNGTEYRLILHDMFYELYQVELAYEEGYADIENGPEEPSSYFNGLTLLSLGCANLDGETEEAIEQFIRTDVQSSENMKKYANYND